MEWIKDEGRPKLINEIDKDFNKSKKVLILTDNKDPLVAEYNKGKDWEQWYCPAYDDVVEGVIGWCDCIPDIINKTTL